MELPPTLVPGLIGGALIGLASALLLITHGRIAGISGIVGQSLLSGFREAWRIPFLVGLPLGAALAALLAVDSGGFEISSEPLRLVVAGLLVGVGTKLGNGCTSGHGVCGMARGSRRSIAATLTFMSTAAVVVFVMRHVIGGTP